MKICMMRLIVFYCFVKNIFKFDMKHNYLVAEAASFIGSFLSKKIKKKIIWFGQSTICQLYLNQTFQKKIILLNKIDYRI